MKDSAVCFTGHRVLSRDFDATCIDKIIEQLIAEGYDTFYDGMASGFDLVCMEKLIKARKRHPNIKAIALLPCKNQERYYSSRDTALYRRLLLQANDVEGGEKPYCTGCMLERDKKLVDNSSVCVAYLHKNFGGTYFTVNYAKQNGLKIIYVD